MGSFGHTGFTGTSVWIDPFSETFVILFTSRLYPDGKGNVVTLRRKVASVVAASLIDAPLPRELYYLRY
jgi:CubicO group peptidase (beta-lactamase class C family)